MTLLINVLKNTVIHSPFGNSYASAFRLTIKTITTGVGCDYQKSTPPQVSRTMDRLVVNKNMTLRYCHPIPVPESDEKSHSNNNNNNNQRPLAVLFAWMLAKDSHLEKYRNLYFKRGFDVLTVRTEPIELAFPKKGSHNVARTFIKFFDDVVFKQYSNVLIHGFSVGAYQLGEVMIQMKNKENESLLPQMQKTVKGMIFDSAADLEAIPGGFSRAITTNFILQPLLEVLITLHMKLFYNISTKYYMASSRAHHEMPLRCPALVLMSNADIVGTPESNQKVMNNWVRLGIDVQSKCWDDSTHVGHLHKHPNEYESLIENFLKYIKMI